MAHFAELNDSNVVLRVVVIADSDADTEANGIAKCQSLFGADTIWKQTDKKTFRNVHADGGTPFRKNYASVGDTYRPDLDAFIPIQHYPSWQLNTTTGGWEPPIPLPNTNVTNGGVMLHEWDEENRSWTEIDIRE